VLCATEVLSNLEDANMPKFIIGQPIRTDKPDVEVSVSRDSPLLPGNHRFQLVVVDDSGLESDPTTIEVIVVDENKPTAIIDGPGKVASGTSFALSGARSMDVLPGKIVSYKWVQLS
jgi:hypothetical protein